MEINFMEMFSTLGRTLFYGGIIGVCISVVLMIIFALTLSISKKKTIKKIESEFDRK